MFITSAVFKGPIPDFLTKLIKLLSPLLYSNRHLSDEALISFKQQIVVVFSHYSDNYSHCKLLHMFLKILEAEKFVMSLDQKIISKLKFKIRSCTFKHNVELEHFNKKY